MKQLMIFPGSEIVGLTSFGVYSLYRVHSFHLMFMTKLSFEPPNGVANNRRPIKKKPIKKTTPII